MTSGRPVLLVLMAASICQAFLPNQKAITPHPESKTHKLFTENSVRQMALIIMNEYPDKYPDQDATLATSSFQWGLKRFLDGATAPDTEDHLINDPASHFDDEKIVSANQLMLEAWTGIINAFNDGDIELAQELTGRLLHTLQDFYSHSNWVELGHDSINPALAVPNEEGNIGTVASIDQPTCIDCNTPECEDNIREDILDLDLLTSGYAYYTMSGEESPPSDAKPADKGKCSHGGIDDLTETIPATGGINKDTTNELKSPHHYLHRDAGILADEASLEFLKSLRNVRNDTEFAKFLGLVTGSSLCYVIDTTGSMDEVIAAVINITTEITNEYANSADPPTDYILAPFNDPEFGPVTVTPYPQVMIDALKSLVAIDGGDPPELFFHGTLMALHHVRPGSTCYTFTDAAAKDVHLLENTIALASSRNIQFVELLTEATAPELRPRPRATQKKARKKKKVPTATLR